MKINAIQSDITTLAVDAIVNAANSTLLGGGGVDGAIHRAAGPELLAACRYLAPCETGQAKMTPGYRLPATFIIHAVGPVYEGNPDAAALLASCYHESLRMADWGDCRSIAFPCISTGIYGYPPDEACRIAVATVRSFRPEALSEVIFCCFSAVDLDRYIHELSPKN